VKVGTWKTALQARHLTDLPAKAAWALQG